MGFLLVDKTPQLPFSTLNLTLIVVLCLPLMLMLSLLMLLLLTSHFVTTGVSMAFTMYVDQLIYHRRDQVIHTLVKYERTPPQPPHPSSHSPLSPPHTHIHTHTKVHQWTVLTPFIPVVIWMFNWFIPVTARVPGLWVCSAIDEADRGLWSWDRSGVFVFHGGGGTIPATHTSLGWTLSGPLHCFSWRPPESDDSKGLWPGSSSQFPLLKLDSMHSRKPFWV